MSDAGATRLDDIRRAFDDSFARAPARPADDQVDLIAFRVAQDRYALRLREVDALVAGRRVVALPGARADCLGYAGFRGVAVPVFDLAVLLGYPARPEVPRWMVVCGREDALALAFDELDGHLRVDAEALMRDTNVRPDRPYVDAMVRPVGPIRAVITVSPLVASIRSRAARPGPALER